MRDYGLIDIEDFEKAYKERFKDYIKLKNDYKEHPIMLMHIGGIIIECFLKDLIVKKYNIKKKKGNDWYTNDAVNSIEQSRVNMDKKVLRSLRYGQDEKDKGNPSHDIEIAYSQLKELNDLIATNEDLAKKIKHIKDPLNNDTYSFIDLRYENINNFEDIEKKFEKWENDFKDVLNWLKQHSSEVEV